MKLLTSFVTIAGVALLALSAATVSGQGKPILVVDIFTLSEGVTLPYDLKLLQPQMVAELKVEVGQKFDVVSEVPQGAKSFYVLDAQIQSWKAGNGAMRFVVGLGTGRESAHIYYRVNDASGKTIFDQHDTIRTNLAAYNAGSTGTITHPIATKMADRIKKNMR